MLIRSAFLLLLSFGLATPPQQDSVYTHQTPSDGGTGKIYFNREIAHIMDFKGSAWLERNSRQTEENSNLTIEKLPIDKNSTIADIGAGTGYYTFKIAPKVPQGRVYAVEIQDEMIAALNERKKELNAANVEVIKGSITSPNLPANSIDLAVMVDVYHELEFPVEMLESIKKSLKEDGNLLLIEYKGEDPAVAIRPLHKTTVEQLNKELGANGFKLAYEGKFLPMQHFLVYTKED